MTYDIEFHDSNIEAVSVVGTKIELRLNAVLIVTHPVKGWLEGEDHRIPALLILETVKFEKLPKLGMILDADIRGISDEKFNGLLPIDFSYTGDVEFLLTMDSGDFKFKCKSLCLSVDRSAIPQHLI